MRGSFMMALALVLLATTVAAGPLYDAFFTDGSLRIDLFHTGQAGKEIYAVDEIIRERHWGGNPRALIDTLGLGDHLLRVYDLATNRLIFSRGYCTIFGEWATTDEALGGAARTFHESLRMPMPKRPVQVRIDRRDRGNIFRNVFDLVVDPDDLRIRSRERFRHLRVRALEHNGDASDKVDIVILGDGYRSDQVHKLRKDARRMVEALFDTEPFAGRRKDFNVRLVETVSDESGVDDPRSRVYRDNLIGLSFNSLDLDRYMLSLDNRTIRDAAARVPYDVIILLANEEKYGGGGIFNLYATSISDNEFDAYVFTHEFGHAFAGLADEYYSSAVTYNEMYPRGVEPWEPNITALLDPANVKWKDLIAEGTPVPTPDDSLYNGVVGCFEGAGYSAEGLFRSYRDCRMFTKGLVDFCPVCRRSIERMIDFHTR